MEDFFQQFCGQLKPLITPDNKMSFWINILAAIAFGFAIYFTKTIWRHLIAAAAAIIKAFTSLAHLVSGRNKIIRVEASEHKDKFPAAGNLAWFHTFNELVDALKDHRAVVCIGPNGSGRTETAISALRENGFPKKVIDEECSFVLIDAAQKSNIQEILEVIIESAGVSHSSEEGISRKIEKI
ncbi:MAG: hypothetical protein JRG71_11780, partial [Deltaproteobacteria bacterium]|nr:hypothetical protein [Deltaproteobacteria bacterium]